MYGSKKTFEWQLVEGEDPILHTAKKPEPEIPERIKVPDYAHLLPEPIQMGKLVKIMIRRHILSHEF